MSSIPILGTNFVLDIDGIGKFPILTLSLPDLAAQKVEEMTIGEGGALDRRVFVDRVDTAEFTVGRALVGKGGAAMELYQWHLSAVNGDYPACARNGSVKGFDSANLLKSEFTFENGWPKTYKWPGLDAKGGSILTEEITIICNLWRRAA